VLLLSDGDVDNIDSAFDCSPGRIKRLIADTAYDADSLRLLLAEQGAKPVIPSPISRRKQISYSKIIYQKRNLIECTFARLSDFRLVAMRYDGLTRNSLPNTMIATTVVWHLN
jgi:transposase